MVIAALALPLCFRHFARLPDAGAGLAFSIGLVFVSTGYFVLRAAGTLPAGRGGIVLTIALFALAMVVLALRTARFASTARRALPGIAVAAALFSALFFGYALFRAHIPDIAHTEQPMDFLHLNAMLVSPEYPPHDAWFAGEDANYYYGGYLRAAILTGASQVWPATGYNLSLAAVFAAAGVAASSLCAALARWALGARPGRWVVAASAGGVLLLLLGGPPAGALDVAAAHGASERALAAFGVEGLTRCGAAAGDSCTGLRLDTSQEWYPDDWWGFWRMSRMAAWERQPAYPDTYLESPALSFLLGDLHPHVMSIPGVVLALALSAVLWRGRGLLSWRSHVRRPGVLVVVAVTFGSLPFVNAWDALGPPAILAAAVFGRNARDAGSAARAASASAGWLAPPALLAVAIFAPWLVSVSSPVGGVDAYADSGTRIEHAFLYWGVLIALALTALGWALRRPGASHLARSLAAASVLPAAPALVWVALVLAGRTAVVSAEGTGLAAAAASRGAGGWAALAFYAVALWLLGGVALALASRRHGGAPVAALATLGILLLFGTELLLLRDQLVHAPRTNTVFKLSYEAWIVLAVASPVALVAAIRSTPTRLRAVLVSPAALLIAISLVFVVTGVPNRLHALHGPPHLDGLAWLEARHPGEYALVSWLPANIEHDAVVVEASGRIWGRDHEGEPVLRDGGPGTPSLGRVASRTGLQVPIGWPGHERQWRGERIRPEIERRRDLVDRVYTAAGEAEALAALRELGASYVVVGVEERDAYRDGIIPRFETFLDAVFSAGEVSVFRVPAREVVPTR